MDRDPVSRRRFVALTGLTLTSTTLAGCAENGGGEPAEATPTPGEAGTPGGTPTPEGTPTPSGEAVDPSAWEGVDEVFLDAYTEGWEGVAPEMINGEQNPTLVFFEGNEYMVTWENRDGALHDFTVWNDNQDALASTERMSEEGQTLSVTFTASPEMVQYVCTVHPNTMIGDVVIESG